VVGGEWRVADIPLLSSVMLMEWFTSQEAVVVVLGQLGRCLEPCQSGTRLRSLRSGLWTMEGINFCICPFHPTLSSLDPQPSTGAPAARQERPPAVQQQGCIGTAHQKW
jgi:hypothetical protein